MEQVKSRATGGAGRAITVAVTGASEYLGSRLVEELRRDPACEKICVIDENRPGCAVGAKTVFAPLDLTLPEAGQELTELFRSHGVNVLVHLAFLTHPQQDVSYAHELQVIGTMHLLNAASAAGIDKVVMLGSTLSYGARADNPNYLCETDPLRGMPDSPLVSDLVEVEKQLAAFAQKHPQVVTTVLRMACQLGSEVDGFFSRLLSAAVVPTVMGRDPLLQFLHQEDAFAAIKLTVTNDWPGAFNIVPEGVLPLSTALRTSGRLALPIPHCLWDRIGGLAWTFQASDTPPSLVDTLRYLFVADGTKAKQVMGFVPRFSTRQTLAEFKRLGRQDATPFSSVT